jgi:hypothetical protein
VDVVGEATWQVHHPHPGWQFDPWRYERCCLRHRCLHSLAPTPPNCHCSYAATARRIPPVIAIGVCAPSHGVMACLLAVSRPFIIAGALLMGL